MNLGPIVLQGHHLRLEPLSPAHEEALLKVSGDGGIWSWMSADLSDRGALRRWIEQAVADEAAGVSYAFAVIDMNTGRTVGSTRYLNIESHDLGVEIGWTWYTPEVWGTRINPEAKLLMLTHAFEDWGALRVALRTDHLNAHSQAAIRKLGAQYEGTLRNHRVRRDGTIRHTLVFSIIRAEWPDVKERLTRRVTAPDVEKPERAD
ncbi:MAG: GNAT family N-acetyltransferase [Firmicutes bacterium]|nr:GNAT family N-acetyltransferase [Bacillota bacterium]